jgi:hypothetical protein
MVGKLRRCGALVLWELGSGLGRLQLHESAPKIHWVKLPGRVGVNRLPHEVQMSEVIS